MKKAVFSLLLAAGLFFAPVQAAPGDVVGNVYATDIKTFLFGQPINSYNLGGKTAIICEDLNWFYGFDVVWDENERTLAVTDKLDGAFYLPGDLSGQRDISQNVKNLPADYFSRPLPQHIYDTDIVTTLNGRQINAYNLNGQTAVVCEDLRDFGYDVVWDAAGRTLCVNEIRRLRTAESDLGTVILNGQLSTYSGVCTSVGTQKVTIGEKECTLPALWAYDCRAPYLALVPTLDAAGIPYGFDGETLAITTNTPPDVALVGDMVNENEGIVPEPEKEIYTVYMNVTVNGVASPFTVTAGGTLLTNGKTYEKEVPAYLYRGLLYVPACFFEKLL